MIIGGADAGMLLINGDPTKAIRLLMDADQSIDLIVKDEKIYKNTLGQ
jgi:imidazolonepropionase-like amidohydrolase